MHGSEFHTVPDPTPPADGAAELARLRRASQGRDASKWLDGATVQALERALDAVHLVKQLVLDQLTDAERARVKHHAEELVRVIGEPDDFDPVDID